ncbi:sigma-70 family RNA polymerase sigma factor [Clostridiaceae bacterium]|nr:sigma-70 family RNA polymerase sigma factor [Clostridiaceae bacterium]NBI83137.1 sigma-70 family RNA polymerase sigma factor [Clostridiaceae bacterium]
MTEAQLVRRAQKNDPDAFVELMEMHKLALYRVAKGFFWDENDIADAMQETVLACFEQIGRLQKPHYFKTWLTRILINKCNDIVRQRQRCTPAESLPEQPYTDPARDEMEFCDFLSALDEKYRLPLLLYYGEGFRVKEIAEMLGMEPETIKSRLRRGREAAKRLYEQQEGGAQHAVAR